MNLRISGQKIKAKKRTNYVGIIVDEHLYFKIHIESIKQIIYNKPRHYVPITMLKPGLFSIVWLTCEFGLPNLGTELQPSH